MSSTAAQSVGVDISKDTLDVAIHPGGESFRITNNPEGHRALIKRLKGFDIARIVFEATGAYHRLFQQAMVEVGQEFLQTNLPVAPASIVLDVRLPGASGLEFQRTLADSSITLPVMFITGHGDSYMSVRAIKSGAKDFLTKPLREQGLLDAVLAGSGPIESRAGRSAWLQNCRNASIC